MCCVLLMRFIDLFTCANLDVGMSFCMKRNFSNDGATLREGGICTTQSAERQIEIFFLFYKMLNA